MTPMKKLHRYTIFVDNKITGQVQASSEAYALHEARRRHKGKKNVRVARVD
jgi:hypothetical protein